MSFKIYPAIDLKNKKCVSLIQGVPGTERVSLDSPLKVAEHWIKQGTDVLHIIDLDGAIQGKRLNDSIISSIIKNFDIETQVGGGIRSKKDAIELLNLGVDRIILGTAAIKNPNIVSELSKEYGKNRIMVALDSKNGRVTTHGWKEISKYTPIELGKKFQELGAGSILFTDINTEGLLKGVNPMPTKQMVESLDIPVIASGGVTQISDIITLKKTGAAGVVIGAALYVGNFTLSEALKSISDE